MKFILSQTSLAACLSLLLFSTPPPAVASRTCYLPSGEVEENDAPCFPQNPESACCGGSQYVCATNNMCAHYDGGYYVIGSCTDPTWNNPACPGYCFFRDHVHNSVVRCAEDTYCCLDGPECNCTTQDNTHKIFDFLPPYSSLVGSSVSLNSAVETTSLFTPSGAIQPPPTTDSTASIKLTRSTAATNTGTQSTASPASTFRSRSSSGSPSSLVNPTRTGDGAAGFTLAPQSPVEKTKDDDIGMKIGLGVGIPLAAIAVFLGALVYRVWMRGAAASAGANTGADAARSGHNSRYSSVSGGDAGGGIAGFFNKLWRKEDPTTRIPMLANTSPSEVRDISINHPANGPEFSLTHGYFKPDAVPVTQTGHQVHEVP
ncbi:hypothetical protein I7I53_00209 [Histoplasma capsulatum var. duboisii H88]|uniref:Mid2 domain-containing protein n=1 Tax=Ajellomyces capsulatus (strain H88) TaxID=544711 RepID=A0A8A1LMG8_AJEC8|nr:hypothetical protein I7I53_00209 [Histoplasma capsulatum var. duboisii H88]